MVREKRVIMKRILSTLKEASLVYNLGIKQAPFAGKMRIVKHLFRRNVLGRNIPLTVIMALTYRCQCDCEHCSVDHYRSQTGRCEMTTEEIKKYIDDIVCLGSVKLNFFGGEPLVRPDLSELIRHAAAQKIFVFVDTNGFLLDHAMAKEMKQSGVSCISVSLDSFDEKKHNEIRRTEGLFNRAVSGLMHCRNERIPCVISVVARRECVRSGELKQIINQAARIGVSGVRILLPMLSGKWADTPETLLTSEDLMLVQSCVRPGFVYIESGFSCLSGAARLKRCSAASKDVIYISPYADVQICYTIPHSFGNLREAPLRSIVDSMWKHELFTCMPTHGCPINNKQYSERLAL
jgi:MoaA/NifB/PqqE/SkfB family radical SAM enzyme